MKQLLITIAALVLVGCEEKNISEWDTGEIEKESELYDYIGKYTLKRFKNEETRTLNLKSDNSFTATHPNDRDDRLVGFWKVDGELLVCEGVTEKSSKNIIIKFHKISGKLHSIINNNGEKVSLINRIPKGRDAIYFRKN